MLWVITVGGFIGMGFSGIFALSELILSWGEWSMLLNYLIATGVFALIFIIGLIALNVVYELDYEESEIAEEYNLVSLKDSSQVNGKLSGGMFYVYASVGEEEVYTYYYELENGGYKRGKVPAEDSIIFEEENCIPKIVEYEVYTKNKLGDGIRTALLFSSEPKNRYEIFVPKGTVLKAFELDSE